MKAKSRVGCGWQVAGCRYNTSNPQPPTPNLNHKAQFFIASAIIMVIMIYFIYFNVLKAGEISSSSIERSDLSYLFSNLKDEYGALVETVLANVSQSGVAANAALDANLTYFTYFVKNLTAQRSIVADITANIEGANSTYMNTSVEMVLKGVNSQIDTTFYSVRELSPSVTQIVTCTKNPPGAANKLDFRVRVRKEYLETIAGLAQGDFTITLNGGAVTPTGFTDEGSGVYLIASSTACATGDSLVVAVTDQRNIKATVTRTT